jgi:hypothetical protein
MKTIPQITVSSLYHLQRLLCRIKNNLKEFKLESTAISFNLNQKEVKLIATAKPFLSIQKEENLDGSAMHFIPIEKAVKSKAFIPNQKEVNLVATAKSAAYIRKEERAANGSIGSKLEQEIIEMSKVSINF